MIRLGSMRHPSAALLLRRLSTDDDHARRRAILDSRRVVRSPLRDAGSAHQSAGPHRRTLDRSPNRPPTHLGNRRQRRNPHSV